MTDAPSQPRRPRSRPTRRPPQRPKMPSDHIGLLIASAVLMLITWFGLFQLISTSLPRIGGELWLFFFLLLIAVSSTVLPIVRYFNVRFIPVGTETPPSGVIVRQSCMGWFVCGHLCLAANPAYIIGAIGIVFGRGVYRDRGVLT